MLKSRAITCLDDMDRWAACSRPKLNPAKSEFSWTATVRRRHLVDNRASHFGDVDASPSTTMRNLGGISRLQPLHGATCRQTRPCRVLPTASFEGHPSLCYNGDAATRLVNGFVVTRIDYRNSLPVGFPDYQLDRVRSVLNYAARSLRQRSCVRTSFHVTFGWINPMQTGRSASRRVGHRKCV